MNNAFFHLYTIALEQGMNEDEAADYASLRLNTMEDE